MQSNHLIKSLVIVLAIANLSTAQQPNSPGAGALWGTSNCSTTSTGIGPFTVNTIGHQVDLQIAGYPSQPYLLLRSPAGLSVGSALSGAGSLDIALSSTQVLLNGLAPSSYFDYLAATDSVGSSSWAFPILQSGYQGAFQVVLADPTSPVGFTLSAATDLTVTEGRTYISTPVNQTVICYPLLYGNMTFYNMNYTSICIAEDGIVAPGQTVSSFNTNGQPLLAPLNIDLAGGLHAGQVGYICFTETPAGFTIDFHDMFQWNGFYIPGTSNSFRVDYSYLTGQLAFTYPPGAQTAPTANIGITPSNGFAPFFSVTDFFPFSSCGTGTTGALPPGQGILGANVPVPSGCVLTFTPTVFNAQAGIAGQYQMP